MDASPYRYLACDITTGDVLQELPLVGVAMQTRLGGGTFSASLPLHGPEGSLPEQHRRDLLATTLPLASTVVALRRGVVVGEWQIVKRTRPPGLGPIALEGVEIVGHLGRRYVTGTQYGSISGGGVELGIEQFDIARALVGDAFGAALGGISLDLGTAVSGVGKARTEWTAGSKTAEDALSEIAATLDGFDYWIETANLDPEGLDLARYLRLAYPSAGIDRPSLVFDIPTEDTPGGSVAAFDGITEDGALYANRVYAIGKDGLLATAEATPYTVEGRVMPVTELAGSWTSVTTVGVLQAHAAALLADSASLYAPPTLSVLADGTPDGLGGYTGPALGDWRLGDRVPVVMAPSLNYPDGLSQTVRIIGWTLTPPNAGPEVVALEIDWTTKPNASAPADLVAVLAEMRRRLRDLET